MRTPISHPVVRLLTATVLTGAVVGTGVAALTSPGSAAAARPDGPRVLSFAIQFAPLTVIDFGTTGVRTITNLRDADPSTGDVSVFHDTLLQAGTPVGVDAGSCMVTHADLTASPPLDISCQVTFDIPGGSIATQGNATDDPVKHLVVTGGTGAFLGATGSVDLTEFADNTGSAVIRLAR